MRHLTPNFVALMTAADSAGFGNPPSGRNLGRYGWVQIEPTMGYRANGLAEAIVGGGFLDVALNIELEDLENEFRFVVGREHHDVPVVVLSPQPFYRFCPRGVIHLQVHDHDVRSQICGLGAQFLAAGGFAYNIKTRLALEQLHESIANRGMIIRK